MTNKSMTSIRLSDRTRAQIDDLIEWGAAVSMTDAIEEALRRMWENEKPQGVPMNEYYTIDSKKMAKVAKIYNKSYGPRSESELRAAILADWEEGDEHQRWVNKAKPAEIASWLASFLD